MERRTFLGLFSIGIATTISPGVLAASNTQADKSEGILLSQNATLTSQDILKEKRTQLRRMEVMINSMTPEERTNPDLVLQAPSRRLRIAKGSGINDQIVFKLVVDYTYSYKMMLESR